MKKYIIILVLATISNTGKAQEKMNRLSINPIQLIGFNITNFEYERGFADGKLGVSFYYGNTGNTTRPIGGYNIYINEQNFSIKKYIRAISNSSFWYGGQISVASGSIRYDLPENATFADYDKYFDNGAYNIGTLGISGKFGYQFIIKSFYIDFYGGAGYAITNNLFRKAVYKGEIEETKFLLNYGLKLGIAF